MSHRNNDFRLIADLARVNAADRADKLAFHFEGRATSYGELDRRSDAAAYALLAAGLQPDERVAYLGKNSDVYFKLLIGAAKAGGVMCPINWRLAPPEIAWILADCGARILFVGPEFAELGQRLQGELPSIERLIGSEDEYPAWRDATIPVSLPVRREDDAVLQMYTSGTTGKPKGAVLTSASILRTALDHDPALSAEWERWSADDVALVAMSTLR